MRCGSIAVKGEDTAPPRFKPRQRHGKRSTKNNPYSAIGLDKFARVYAELSAKRESIAAQTGAPASLVRFVYAHRGWVPLVVRTNEDPKKIFGDDGGGDRGGVVSILAPIKAPHKKKKKKNPNEDNLVVVHGGSKASGGGKQESDKEKNSVSHDVSKGIENNNITAAADANNFPWRQVLKTTAFGFIAVSAIYVWKSAVPAGAMAVVMVVAELQRRWQGGAMTMKKFLEGGLSYLSQICMRWKTRNVENNRLPPIRTSTASTNDDTDKKIINNSKVKSAPPSKNHGNRGLTVSAPVSPTFRPHLETAFCHSTISSPRAKGKSLLPPSKPKKLRKVVSMEHHLVKPSETHRRKGMTMAVRGHLHDASVGATVLMIALACLALSGRLCATICISMWWYLLPRLRPPSSSSSAYQPMNKHRKLRLNGSMGGLSINNRNVDLQSSEYKKKAIMGGLVDRSHLKP